MASFGFRQAAVMALGFCMAAVACSDDGDSNGGATAGSAGTGGGPAGSSSTAGSQTAGSSTSGSSTGGTHTAGTGGSGGADSSGNGGVSGGGSTGQPKAGSANGGASGDAGAGSGGEAGTPLGGQGGQAGQGGQPSGVDEAGTGGGGDGGATGQPSCVVASYGEVQPTGSKAVYDTADEVMTLTLKLQDGIPRDEVEVTMWDGLGTFKNGIKEGTYEIKGDDLDYKYCTLCVVLYDQVNLFGGNRGWYMATGGSLTLTSVEGNLTGSLANVTFQHVYEDNGGHSVPWADGCTTSVQGVGFDTEIVEQ
ncbi:MAG TPA: hypothetical protein VHB79_29845 [Polyangiaceae bacterium]|nr:hypothetical protein [Polyangiaceae bacterium]